MWVGRKLVHLRLDARSTAGQMSRTIAVMLCVLLLSRGSRAQLPIGALDGVVRDTTAGVIVSATVQARARSTGQTWTTRTGDRGQFGFPNLPPGEYELTAEAPGFRRFTRTAIVEVASTTRADLTLPIATDQRDRLLRSISFISRPDRAPHTMTPPTSGPWPC
jgi:hypothetical protein